MHIAMVGIGDIAQKAWLPALNELDNVSAVLVARNVERHAMLAARWQRQVFTSLDQAIAARRPDWVTIHAATPAHFELAKQALLAGVSVLVDKPIATSMTELQALYDLAKQHDCQVICGFNRRTAALYSALVEFGGSAWQLSKHRHQLPGEVTSFLFDDFIHVLDSLLWWTGQPDTMHVTAMKDNQGRMLELAVHWMHQDKRAFGEMSRRAGADVELARVVGNDQHMQVENLKSAEVVRQRARQITTLGDWQSVASQRGFVQLLQLLNKQDARWMSRWQLHDWMTHQWLSQLAKVLIGNSQTSFQVTLTKENIS